MELVESLEVKAKYATRIFRCRKQLNLNPLPLTLNNILFLVMQNKS